MLDKTYSPKDVEPRHYGQWEGSGAFAANTGSNAKPYTIMMPPPNVTGSLHMGHALTFTLQDVLIRYHRMKGMDALWQPGTDHAGIATQMVVERQLEGEGKNRHDLGRDDFIKRVWEWKAESGGTITRQLRRLGASPDWAKERFTMDEGLSAAVRKVFVDLYKKNLIYRDKRLVNWDPKLHTAISDLEVESREIRGSMWHFRYPIEGMAGRYIVVATTRPETMLGDTAVAVHPDDDRYRDIVGKNVILPIVGRKIPIVADDYSDPEKGTGAVKITPAHDFNDFEVGKRHGLGFINVLDKDARILHEVRCEYLKGSSIHPEEFHDAGVDTNQVFESLPDWLGGLDRFEARKCIVAKFEELELLDKIEPHTLMVPYGDRSGVVIEPWLTDQWFVDAATLAKPAIEAVESGKTKFVPKNWENTYYDWMRNIQPWCISRQIWWGHQVPAWYGPKSKEFPNGNIFVELTEEDARKAARDLYKTDCILFDNEVPTNTEKAHSLAEGLEPIILTRDSDVLDTWFSSALWPFSTLGWPTETPELKRYYPTDVLVTGFDIIFFWVARMMMMGLHFMGDVPFHTIYIHALVRDEKGQKMSKSKGNIIDPLDLIEKFGCDALRFTLCALAAQGRDIKLAESRVEGYRNFATKLWNASRFTEMNECKLVAGFDPWRVELTLNKWILAKTAEAGEKVAQALDAYRFNDAANAAYAFVWNSFCDWFLEFAKPVFNGSDEKAKAETRATTAWVLDQILHLLHPFMPFVTEELWEKLGENRAGRLIGARWPSHESALAAPEAEAEMDWVVRLISSIRSVRAEMNVPPAAKLSLLLKGASAATKQRLETHLPLILTLARLETAVANDAEAPKGAVQVVVDEATAILPLAGHIDVAKETARLAKEIAKLADDIGKTEKKLSNPAFVEKADPDVVAEARERMAELAIAKGKLSEALERLKEM